MFGILLILLLFIGALAIHSIYENKCIEYVKANSKCFQEIIKLNANQKFYQIKNNVKLYKSCNSTQQYNNFNAENFISEKIDNELEEYKNLVIYVRKNQEKYSDYEVKFKNEVYQNRYVYTSMLQNFNISYDKFRKIEKKLCEEIKLKPTVDINLKVIVYYTSPQGRNHYETPFYFNCNDIEILVQECIDERKYKATEEYRREKLRRELTPQIKETIKRRDGYRCCNCKATPEDGFTKLEVDHIIPISKGGTNDMSNLQTLCRACNRKKSNSLHRKGI